MIPIRDDIPSSITPYVNYVMIGACSLVFVIQLLQGDRVEGFIERYGMIPAAVSHPGEEIVIQEKALQRVGPFVREVLVPRKIEQPPIPSWLTMITCVFLHGGWMHFLGNMLFLYIFGDNVEDRLGHIGYLIFYLVMGVAASLSHYITDPSSPVPTIGASGAIAGVMGAYILLYPHARVLTIVPIIYFLEFIELPAWIMLGVWFLTQLFQGTAALRGEFTGVAWWAHIGGFAAGAIVVYGLKTVRLLRPEKPRVGPHVPAFTHHSRRIF